ncbi:hypothetical protein GWK47_003128 [Chionoecetes opilio]|uniref:Uncharacterized protein n=1 Tax=Chionoecetes opilio TaxID=41210 RepID=A0A8J8WNG7_CHIOP|nr:hypothetical protein GWK47_003128 [Chionoecetes opilio]
MSAHCSTSAPATDLALLKALAAYRDKEIGRASGKVMARHMWYVSEELVGLSLFDEATVVEEEAGHRQRHASSGWGRRTRLAAPDVAPRRSGAALPGVVCDDQLCRPRHRPRGRSRFPQRRSGRVVGEGRLHHGSSARPSPRVSERLCGEGRRALISAFCGGHHSATRNSDSTFCRSWSATGRCTPVREIGYDPETPSGIGPEGATGALFDSPDRCSNLLPELGLALGGVLPSSAALGG